MWYRMMEEWGIECIILDGKMGEGFFMSWYLSSGRMFLEEEIESVEVLK